MTIIKALVSEVFTHYDPLKVSSSANVLSDLRAQSKIVIAITRSLVQYNTNFDSNPHCFFECACAEHVSRAVVLLGSGRSAVKSTYRSYVDVKKLERRILELWSALG